MINERSNRPLALTMGDPAGIGGDIALMAWRRRKKNSPRFFVVDDPTRLADLAERLGFPSTVCTVNSPEQASIMFDSALPI